MAPDRNPEQLYTITELAAELAVTARAIRFYESKGLLAPQRAGANRVYDYRDRARLLIILRGKRLGFSLALIKQYLDLYDADPTHREQLVHLLRGARQRIDELAAQRRDLELTIEELQEVEAQVLAAMREAGLTPETDSSLPRPRRQPPGERRAGQLRRVAGYRDPRMPPPGPATVGAAKPAVLESSAPVAPPVASPVPAAAEPDPDGGSQTP